MYHLAASDSTQHLSADRAKGKEEGFTSISGIDYFGTQRSRVSPFWTQVTPYAKKKKKKEKRNKERKKKKIHNSKLCCVPILTSITTGRFQKSRLPQSSDCLFCLSIIYRINKELQQPATNWMTIGKFLFALHFACPGTHHSYPLFLCMKFKQNATLARFVV